MQLSQESWATGRMGLKFFEPLFPGSHENPERSAMVSGYAASTVRASTLMCLFYSLSTAAP